MRLGLPEPSDGAAYERLFRSPVWERAAAALCDRHGLRGARLRRSPQGENVIFFAGAGAVVKLYPVARANLGRRPLPDGGAEVALVGGAVWRVG